ncbi:carboxypeptidase-like regulatory domain-containing protein [Desulfovibrio sp. Fe33]|uniref:carboxypeptidase-like regulatory domain-containing protein n=1 Tax=Desulfovibrio sp. Fe33 TaxID=3020842 RepID=UPI00234E1E54|nr:carboxypeptidase-like regulatory domain-containing protein [Desulfovibrio sp. Fe33]
MPDDSALPEPFVLTGEDIILDVYLRRQLLYQGLFCQGRGSEVYVPLGELCGVLGFPITVDGEGARGWYISEDREFSLSSATGEVRNRGAARTLPQNSYFTSADEIFISAETFSSLFPVKLNIDLHTMILYVIPGEYLPMELMKLRRDKLRMNRAKQGLRYPLQDLDYAAVALPRLDAKISSGYSNRDGKEDSSLSMAGLFRGDLLYMSTALYGSVSQDLGGKDDGLQFKDFSLTAERLLRQNPYLTKVTAGDIVPSSTPLGSGGTLERGLRVSNTEIGSSSSSYDTRTVTGKALPGWDVELYRNNQLIGFQTIGSDGTYLFRDVPLFHGVNRFKLKLYGTEGQQEEREDVVTVGASVKPGQVVYDASISQQGKGVFAEENSRVIPVEQDLEGTVRGKAGVRVGLGKGMELRSGLTRDTYRRRDRTVGSLGLSGGYDAVLGQMDVGYSTYGSVVGKGSLRGSMESGTNYTVAGLVQSSANWEENATKNDFTAQISDSATPFETLSISYGGNMGRTTTVGEGERESSYYTLGGNMSFFGDYGQFSTNLSGRAYEKKLSDEDPFLYGSSTFYTGTDTATLRASADYGLNKEEGAYVRNFTASGTLRLSKKLTTSLTLSKYLVDSHRFSVSNTWSYIVGNLTPYIQNTWSDDDSFSVFAGVSMSIDFDPDTFLPKLSRGGANYSGASCLVYNDRNYNETFDEGDEPVKDVVLSADQSHRKAVTNENGRALFTYLPPLQSTDVSVEQDSIRDISLSSRSGTAIFPRKGKIYDLEFPLHATGDADGYVYLLQDDEARGKPMTPVELLDKDGTVVGSTWTEQDGFFIIDDIMPGTYTLRVKDDFLSDRKFVGTTTTLTVSEAGESLRGNYLFYGEDKTVAVLREKFENSLRLGDDIQMFTSFADLDSPMHDGIAQGGAERGVLKLDEPEPEHAARKAEIDSPAHAPEDGGERPSAPLSASKTASPGKETASAPAKPAQKMLPPGTALVADTFVSEENARRAVRHYNAKYATLLKGCEVTYQPEGDAYVVVVSGIRSNRQLKDLSTRFLCTPRLVRLAPGSAAK